MRFRLLVSAIAAVGAFAMSEPRAATSTVITVDAAQRFQTFDGWETVILPTVRDDYGAWMSFFQTVVEQGVDDLGVTRVRVDVPAGLEGEAGFGQQYLDGVITQRQYIREHAYNIINDNRNAKKADLSRFDFALLDWQFSRMVVPHRERVLAAGKKPYVYLTYVDFGKSDFEHYDHPNEYAEYMLVLFEHLSKTFGFVPDGIDVINEPDQTPWDPQRIGRAVAATGKRLASAGYHPDFLVASTVNRAHAVSYLDGILGERGAAPFVKALTFHCYSDSGERSRAAIAARALAAGIPTGMNECWGTGNDARALLRDLKEAGASTWQQGNWFGANGYYFVDLEKSTVTLRPKTQLLRQFYHYIRSGDVRVEATTSDAAFDPVAFVDPAGRTTVVVVASGQGDVTITRLPAGTYDVSYTTAASFDVHAPRVTLADGQPLTTTMPAQGVLTIHAE